MCWLSQFCLHFDYYILRKHLGETKPLNVVTCIVYRTDTLKVDNELMFCVHPVTAIYVGCFFAQFGFVRHFFLTSAFAFILTIVGHCYGCRRLQSVLCACQSHNYTQPKSNNWYFNYRVKRSVFMRHANYHHQLVYLLSFFMLYSFYT